MYHGMLSCTPLHNSLLAKQMDAKSLHALLSEYYTGSALISVMPFGSEPARMHADEMAGSDCLRIYVTGHETQTMLLAEFDNLGKGASGAAVQNMNLMLGFAETAGLRLSK